MIDPRTTATYAIRCNLWIACTAMIAMFVLPIVDGEKFGGVWIYVLTTACAGSASSAVLVWIVLRRSGSFDPKPDLTFLTCVNKPQDNSNSQHPNPYPTRDPMQHLLGRPEVDAHNRCDTDTYQGRTVLISGAGGSIGSELCRQILGSQPRKLILYDVSEAALYQIYHALLPAAQGIDVVPVLGSVVNASQVRRVMQEHGVQVVVHAAAYKHVPMVECNVLAGLENNVFGTHSIATASVDASVERFILISTDKAVHPSSMMGASKRLAELLVRDIAQRGNGPVMSIVRFGNVLGSSGSVVPMFQQQVRDGGPITVTHPYAARYFMTVQEAVHLVLCAGSIAQGGETFVLDMGKPVNIEQLARQIVTAAGRDVRDATNPKGDIEIKFTGLRPGEKLTEELTFNGQLLPTKHPKLFAAREDSYSEIKVALALEALRDAIVENDEGAARDQVFRWVEPSCDTPERVAYG